MLEADSAQWVATGIIAIGLGISILKNARGNKREEIAEGKKESKQMSELQSDIKHIKDKIDDPYSGLNAIKSAVDEQKLHCVEVSTALKGRVNTLERNNKAK